MQVLQFSLVNDSEAQIYYILCIICFVVTFL